MTIKCRIVSVAQTDTATQRRHSRPLLFYIYHLSFHKCRIFRNCKKTHTLAIETHYFIYLFIFPFHIYILHCIVFAPTNCITHMVSLNTHTQHTYSMAQSARSYATEQNAKYKVHLYKTATNKLVSFVSNINCVIVGRWNTIYWLCF